MMDQRVPNIIQRQTLCHSLQYWSLRKPDAIYLTQPLPDGSVVDYRWGEVNDQIRRVASWLQQLGLPPGSPIALLGKNSAHWIMADLAIALAGHVSVPLYPSLNADTARYVLQHSEARLLMLGKLDDDAAWAHIREILPAGLPVLRLPLAPPLDGRQWDEVVRDTPPSDALAPPSPSALATILYTSGSTGLPKGVMHAHGTIAQGAEALRELMSIGEEDRLLSYLPLAHVAERLAVGAVSVHTGCRVYFSDSLETFAADLQRARPTVFFSVPRLWTKFYLSVQQQLNPQMQAAIGLPGPQGDAVRKAVLGKLGLADTRVAMTGSAPLPQAILDWYRALGLELLELYGMSENLAYSHAARPGQTRPGYIGHAMPGVEARIAADGELLVKSPCQMMGYYKAAEKTAAETTADGYFRTGDRGELDDEGRLRITGRVKELFKTSKGKYVAPAPIENRIASHPAVESACVAGLGQPQPLALVMLSPEALARAQDTDARIALEGTLASLLDDINATLEDHEKLACLVLMREPWTIENGQLTPTLKIRRDAIERRAAELIDQWTTQRRSVVWS